MISITAATLIGTKMLFEGVETTGARKSHRLNVLSTYRALARDCAALPNSSSGGKEKTSGLVNQDGCML